MVKLIQILSKDVLQDELHLLEGTNARLPHSLWTNRPNRTWKGSNGVQAKWVGEIWSGSPCYHSYAYVWVYVLHCTIMYDNSSVLEDVVRHIQEKTGRYEDCYWPAQCIEGRLNLILAQLYINLSFWKRSIFGVFLKGNDSLSLSLSLCMNVCMSMHVCIYVWMCECLHLYLNAWMCMNMQVYVWCLYVFVYMHLCVYMNLWRLIHDIPRRPWCTRRTNCDLKVTTWICMWMHVRMCLNA